MPEQPNDPPAPPSETAPTRFEQLMARVRTGCGDAARQLYDEYGEVVERAVRRRLHPRLRPVYETADFSQAVWASFLAAPEARTFVGPEDLVHFLCHLATNKVGMAHRQANAQKRDVLRTGTLVALEEDDAALRDRNPSPSQVAIADETLQRLQDGQSELLRAALDLLRRGFTHVETAAQLGLHPKQIQRLLRNLSSG